MNFKYKYSINFVFYLDYIKSYKNDNENVKIPAQFPKQYYIKESATIPDLLEISKLIFIENKETHRVNKQNNNIYILPLVFNMLNNVGTILLECSSHRI